jgi:hypothetical protein
MLTVRSTRTNMKLERFSAAALLAASMLFAGSAWPQGKSKEVPDVFTANNNPKGSECYKKVAQIRKLEADPRFDTTKSIRQDWQRKVEEASRLKCKL